MASHSFFQTKGFNYIHTPLITGSDCEGAGELFSVKSEKGSSSFFKKEAYLSVSGQLSVENYCCGLGDVYTFGPTFRAENSHTKKHLSEFWMIEPEIAFAELDENMDLAEEYLKYVL